MKQPKILLVNPNIRPFQFAFEIFMTYKGFFPLGLGYLASFIGKHGYEVKILDAFSDELSQKDIHAAIKEFSPDIVAVTSPTNYEFGIGTFKACKNINPKIVTILGGLTPTFMPFEIMEHVPELDCIVRGEGEIPFLYLLRALEGEMSFGDIKGLVYRKDGKAIVANEGRYRIEELDSLPSPSKDRFLIKNGAPYFKHRRYISIETMRGCYYDCKFCVVNKHFGKGVRYRDPKLVVDELRECVEKYRINLFWFWDSTFTADPQYTHRLLDEIIKSNVHMKFRFRCMTRLDCVDVDLLKKLKAANCCSVAYGVESCSQKVLDSYNKHLKIEKTIDVFNETQKAGMSAKALLVFNQYENPGKEGIRRHEDDLIAFLKKLKPSEFLLVPLIICPNSPMYDEILNRGGIDTDGYKELFRKRLIPSKWISNSEIERSVSKVFSEFSLMSRIKITAYNLFRSRSDEYV